MPVETENLPQKAVLLTKSGADMYGKPTTAAAVEIDCRWENVTETVNESPDKVVSTIANIVVDRDIAKGSILWLGSIIDFVSPYTELHEVYLFSKIPDLKGRNFRRRVKTIRFTDKLPSLT
mgnify:CR=1 FL=1|tara:strand:+ start:61641 stop:62003 length:363 start_codon:yes stop_codon:yes gene_type:complete